MSLPFRVTIPMEGVQIPPWFLFEVMMKQMQLPPPIYTTSAAEEGEIIARVVFYPSIECFQDPLQPKSLSSYPSNSTDISIDDATLQAIEYMETVKKKVIKDYHYTEMEKGKKANEVLVQQVKERDETINEKTNQLVELAKSYLNFANTTCGFRCLICSITCDNLTLDSNAIVGMHNGTHLNIEAISSDLKNISFDSWEQLKDKGAAGPALSDFAGDEYFPSCSGSDATLSGPWDSEVYNYDSDGLPLDYFGSEFDSDY